MFFEIDVNQWHEMALSSLNYTYYQSIHYAKVYEEVFNTKTRCFVLKNSCGSVVVSGLAKISDDNLTFDFGPLVYQNTKPQDVAKFLCCVQKQINKKIKFTFNKQLEKHFGNLDHIPTYFSFYTLVLSIPKTEKEFLDKCNENRRRIIKKVKDKGFVIETDNSNLDEFYKIFVQRLVDNKADLVPPTYEFFKALLEHEGATLIVCKKDGIIYSGMIAFVFNKYLETRYNTNNTEYIKENAGTYLDYYLISNFIKTREIEHYDFAGYSEHAEGKFVGINQYKHSYGGDICNFQFKTLDCDANC